MSESKSESKSMSMPASHQENQTDPVSLVTRLRLAAYRRGLCDHGVDVDEGKYESYKAELCAKAAENKSKGGKGGKGVGAQKDKKDKKDKQEKSPAPLPFDGVKNEDNCEAVRLNSGLYTQCALKKKADQRWCLACGKQAAKNSSGKPDNGAMEDRLAVGPMEYVDPKGRKVVAYCAVLKKLKVSQAEMVAYCESANLPPIMAVHLQEAEKEKEDGSKKKATKAKKAKKVKEEVEVEEEVKEEVEVKEKEKKGRPKKAKKEPTVTSNSTEDLFASLVSQQQQQQQQEAKVDEKKVDDKKKRGGGAKKEAPAPAPVSAAVSTMAPVKRERTPVLEDEVDNTIVASSSKAGNPVPVSVSVTDSELAEEQEEQEEQEQDEDEEEEDHVEPVKVGRKNYLRSMKSGVMYDAKTQEPVGIWNPTTKKIDELPAEEGDDEDEE